MLKFDIIPTDYILVFKLFLSFGTWPVLYVLKCFLVSCVGGKPKIYAFNPLTWIKFLTYAALLQLITNTFVVII